MSVTIENLPQDQGQRAFRSRWLRSAGPGRKIVLVGSLAIILMLALTIAIAVRRYNIELTDAGRELRTLDVLLAEETGRSLQNVDLVLDNIVDQVTGENVTTPEAFVERESTKAVHDMLRARVAGLPQLDAVTMISAEGKLINFSRAWPIPEIDLSDRAYFRHLRDHQTETTYLSEPVINRGSGTPTIYLARRISGPNGVFLGLVLGAIELGYFDRFYASLRLDSGHFIALWRQDGLLLARYPPAQAGQRMPPEAITSPVKVWRGIPNVFEKTWTIDGGPPEKRVVASQDVDGFPLQINLGQSKALILADWRREVVAIGSAVALAVLCVAVMMWALLRRFHAYEVVAAASRERERAIMDRQKAEDALRQAQKIEAVGQLTGGVAHDFNNLLMIMRSSVDLLRRPNLTEERRDRYIEAISDATNRAAKLTTQLLAFARRQALKPEVFDVVENVAAVAHLVERLTGGGRVSVETVLPDHPCHVEADPNQLDTAIVNMAVNGRDAMANGGRLTITVKTTDRIPATRAHPMVAGSFVAISVDDTGTGIAPEMIERVFEPFFTTKTVGQGTGLGLSQVFGFAKQSGGEVLLSSTLGQGTTFTLYLPRATVDRAAAREEAHEAPSVVGEDGKRVLVVEDNEEVGRSTMQLLMELGYEARWAASAEDALAILGSGTDRFDIVFSDVVMPGMNGIELGQIIRRTFGGLPVVLASGYSPVLAEQGSDGFALLQKPYSMDDLARALQNAGTPLAVC